MAMKNDSRSDKKSKLAKSESSESGEELFAADFESAQPSESQQMAETEAGELPDYGKNGRIFQELIDSVRHLKSSNLGLREKLLGGGTESVPEDIIGVDDRVRIDDTNRFPYAVVCHLLMRFGSESFLGTGIFVSPTTVLTVGHNLYEPDKRRWASSIEVSPGRNGSRIGKTFSAGRSNFRTTTGWLRGAAAADVGAIVFGQGVMDDFVGYRSFESNEEDELRGLSVAVVGYPGRDKHPQPGNFNTMWGHMRRLQSFSDDRLFYDVDTTKGQSGSPVLYQNNEGRFYVVGVHNYGDARNNRNIATRISNPLFDLIESWAR